MVAKRSVLLVEEISVKNHQSACRLSICAPNKRESHDIPESPFLIDDLSPGV